VLNPGFFYGRDKLNPVPLRRQLKKIRFLFWPALPMAVLWCYLA